VPACGLAERLPELQARCVLLLGCGAWPMKVGRLAAAALVLQVLILAILLKLLIR
jgi:hypothetical protein